MFLSTTSSIENYQIETHIGVVCHNIVIGSNLFSDFFASFSDVFGGHSGSYQSKMDLMYNEAMNSLSVKARAKGANAVIGIKIDFDEIAGQGKQMFMLSATGTAVKVYQPQKPTKVFHGNDILVTRDELYKHISIKKYKEKFESSSPTQVDYDDITHNRIYGLEQVIYNRYTEIGDRQLDSVSKTIFKNLLNFQLENLTFDNACDLVYSKVTEPSCRFLVCEYIVEHRLFNPKKILELLDQGENKVTTILLEADKEFYTNEDHLLMQKIVEKLDALSHSNYSLDKTQKEQIKQFKEKVELLNSCAAANSF